MDQLLFSVGGVACRVPCKGRQHRGLLEKGHLGPARVATGTGPPERGRGPQENFCPSAHFQFAKWVRR